MLRFREVEEKARAAAWSPVFIDGDRRSNDNVKWISCIVLDIDDGAPLEDVCSKWEGGLHAWHTSWSHKPDHPKGRLIVPLAKPCPVEFWPRLWRLAQHKSGMVADEQAKDPSRVYFLPAHKPGESEGHSSGFQSYGNNGWLWDFAPFCDLPKTPAELQAETVKQWKKRAPRVPAKPGEDRERMRRQDLLKNDYRERSAWAVNVGARVASGYARKAPCPSCGRRSVWWPLEPTAFHGAACSHRNSCGWHGWLDEVVG
jgi:hypothetical protein